MASILIVGFSCKKENTSNSLTIQGVWEERVASGSFTTTFPPGNDHIITFTTDHYEISSGGQVTKSGSFQVLRDPSAATETCLDIQQGQYVNRIIYDGNTSAKKIFLEISNDKLTFLSGCFAYDGGTSEEYARQ
ncbi:MAG TPA: hypothetical protein VK588_13060, partial [Chitinophagaceae bacterium]|nr:hypothetical protein [Chitinophagaceae bacterium]